MKSAHQSTVAPHHSFLSGLGRKLLAILTLVTAVSACAEEARSVTIEIRQGKVYEIAALWVRPDMRVQLQGYFKQAMPLALKHGARPLVGFSLARASIGDFDPSQLGLAEWPSEEAFEAFLNDPDAQALFPLRDGAVSRMEVSHTSAIPPGEYTFSEGKIYEFAFLWVKEGMGEQLQKYFDFVKPLAHTKHGCSTVCGMQGLRPKFGHLDAHMVGLTQWDSLQQFDGFIKDPVAAAHFHERDEALNKLQVSHFILALPPKSKK
ncbi:MAG: DUF1330 domain-containing protein [Opitutae bacterium]|nr:DUF1330 domain-containing protein [Opitutae bacterium]